MLGIGLRFSFLKDIRTCDIFNVSLNLWTSYLRSFKKINPGVDLIEAS